MQKRLEHFPEDGAAPCGSQTQDQAADGVNCSEGEGSRPKIVESLPLKRGKSAVGTDEADGAEEAPRRVDIHTLAEESECKPDYDAGSEVNDKCPVRKTGAQAAADRGPYPIARGRSERSSQSNEQILLQSCSPFASLPVHSNGKSPRSAPRRRCNDTPECSSPQGVTCGKQIVQGTGVGT